MLSLFYHQPDDGPHNPLLLDECYFLRNPLLHQQKITHPLSDEMKSSLALPFYNLGCYFLALLNSESRLCNFSASPIFPFTFRRPVINACVPFKSPADIFIKSSRSEERRVGKECVFKRVKHAS